MKSLVSSSRRVLGIATVTVLGIALVPAAASAAPGADAAAVRARHQSERPKFFDARAGATPAGQAAFKAADQSGALAKLRDSLGVQGIVELDEATHTARRVARLDGFLTGPSSKPARDVAVRILGYSYLMVLTSLALWPVADTGLVYPVVALVLGVAFLLEAHRMHARATRSDDLTVVRPMRLFHWSNMYLSLLFVTVALDPLLHIPL